MECKCWAQVKYVMEVELAGVLFSGEVLGCSLLVGKGLAENSHGNIWSGTL